MLALAAVVLALLALAVGRGSAHWGGREAGRDTAQAELPRVEAERLAAPETRDSAREPEPTPPARSDALRHVLSSTGLELARIEVQLPNGHWEEHPNHGIALAQHPAPFRVRAAGHAPQRFEAQRTEVVLEPVALFEIEGEDLASALRAVLPFQPAPYPAAESVEPAEEEFIAPGAAVFGFVSNERWCLALAAFERDEPVTRPLEIVWRGLSRSRVRLALEPGLRARWRVSTARLVPTAPLRLAFVRPPDDAPGRLRLVVRGRPFGSVRRESHLWGEVEHLLQGDVNVAVTLDPRTTEFSLDELPLTARFELGVLDLASGATGGAQFEHSQRVLPIKLEPGTSVSGRLVLPPGYPPLESFELTWQQRMDQDADPVPAWSGQWQQPLSSQDGVFTFSVPRDLRDPDHLRQRPPWGTLHVQALGYAGLEATLQITRAHNDLGDLVLDPWEPFVVLDRDPLAGAPPGDGWNAILLDSDPGLEFCARASFPLPGELFGLRVLVLDEQGQRSAERTDLWEAGGRYRAKTGPERRRSGTAALLFEAADEYQAFERDGLGVFRSVPELTQRVRVTGEHTTSRCQVGWSWRGIPVRLGSVFGLEPVEFRFRAPAQGAALTLSRYPLALARDVTHIPLEGSELDLRVP